ncbi:MAG: right-handed parallel beta-helix repeat-containing protein [Planctomycetaceae bacterium]|nr:right-handed parallel beta-helix repeat-containing protein [Planctomycetaceae bacterium]
MYALRVGISVPVLVLLAISGRSVDAATLHVPEDHETIQAAIDVAVSGDTILVRAGTYRERLRLKTGITLRSAGDETKGNLGLKRAEETIIDGTGGDEDLPGVTMAEDSTIDGFTVTGVGTYDDEAWNKHHASQGENQSYESIGKPGVAGISVIRIPDCKVLNNIVHHVGYTGIVVMGAEGIRVSPHIFGNFTYRNMGGGIGAMMNSSPTIEENTCFENFYAGIGHAMNASPLVINNTCYGNVRAGIGISEGSKPIVRGNRCYQNRRAGIGIRTGIETTPLVEHNECYDNDLAGIGVREDAAPILRHNRCYRNQEAGIGCRTGATPLIEHNECFENGMSGIGCRSKASPVIRNNHCYRNKTSGIGSQDGARPVIIGNDCFENQMAGIGTEEGARTVIRDNECYRNSQAGIGIRANADSIIDGNHCYENLLAGIGAEDEANVVIRGNLCEQNEQTGIGVQNGAKALIVSNKCRENRQSGIGVREKSRALVIHNQCIENQMVAIGVRSESQAQILGNELKRTGGMPPMIAIQEESRALIEGNTISGGGVAGVLVRGTATLIGNQMDGNGPRKGPGPPHFAVWVHEGSTVTFVDNQVDRWRHSLSASNAENVRVIGNTTSRFLDTAIVVVNSKQPAHVSGNVAVSDDEKDECVRITGPQGVVSDNTLRTPRQPQMAPATESTREN